MQGLGVYAEVLLCPPELQRRRGRFRVLAVGERALAKGRIIRNPGMMPGFLVGQPWVMRGWDGQHKRPARQQVPRVLFTHPND
jgi:hypothetical protein